MYNHWYVSDLKELLLQYDLYPTKGSGKNGNIIKSDLFKATKKSQMKLNLFHLYLLKLLKKSIVI